uniref:Uncharacterized protein n=1 Tax=Arundo donax TaxID=35708 RepID=A0A0A9EJU9_ARUDO
MTRGPGPTVSQSTC